MVVYRLWDPQEQKFVASGRSLYSTNGRTLWVGKSGAVNTKRNLPDDVRERVELVTYELVEVAREKSEHELMPKPNWADAPDWANWWAVQRDGRVFWFEHEPVLFGAENGYETWYVPLKTQWLGANFVTRTQNWKLTKTQRPQASI